MMSKMILEEIEMKKKGLPIFVELKRIRLTYRIYRYIDSKGRCVINSIKKNTGANLKTIYRHVRYLSKRRLITQDFGAEKKKDGGYFFIITTPALKIELKKIEVMIDDFLSN